MSLTRWTSSKTCSKKSALAQLIYARTTEAAAPVAIAHGGFGYAALRHCGQRGPTYGADSRPTLSNRGDSEDAQGGKWSIDGFEDVLTGVLESKTPSSYFARGGNGNGEGRGRRAAPPNICFSFVIRITYQPSWIMSTRSALQLIQRCGALICKAAARMRQTVNVFLYSLMCTPLQNSRRDPDSTKPRDFEPTPTRLDQAREANRRPRYRKLQVGASRRYDDAQRPANTRGTRAMLSNTGTQCTHGDPRGYAGLKAPRARSKWPHAHRRRDFAFRAGINIYVLSVQFKRDGNKPVLESAQWRRYLQQPLPDPCCSRLGTPLSEITRSDDDLGERKTHEREDYSLVLTQPWKWLGPIAVSLRRYLGFLASRYPSKSNIISEQYLDLCFACNALLAALPLLRAWWLRIPLSRSWSVAIAIAMQESTHCADSHSIDDIVAEEMHRCRAVRGEKRRGKAADQKKKAHEELSLVRRTTRLANRREAERRGLDDHRQASRVGSSTNCLSLRLGLTPPPVFWPVRGLKMRYGATSDNIIFCCSISRSTMLQPAADEMVIAMRRMDDLTARMKLSSTESNHQEHRSFMLPFMAFYLLIPGFSYWSPPSMPIFALVGVPLATSPSAKNIKFPAFTEILSYCKICKKIMTLHNTPVRDAIRPRKIYIPVESYSRSQSHSRSMHGLIPKADKRAAILEVFHDLIKAPSLLLFLLDYLRSTGGIIPPVTLRAAHGRAANNPHLFRYTDFKSGFLRTPVVAGGQLQICQYRNSGAGICIRWIASRHVDRLVRILRSYTADIPTALFILDLLPASIFSSHKIYGNTVVGCVVSDEHCRPVRRTWLAGRFFASADWKFTIFEDPRSADDVATNTHINYYSPLLRLLDHKLNCSLGDPFAQSCQIFGCSISDPFVLSQMKDIHADISGIRVELKIQVE
ncbi:hypothetical protein C8R44DRAFT_741618 [Mycena epipterygia]|nr:hypothetical protein C8R44DRAFT_741618 [Mycena epipterygia]